VKGLAVSQIAGREIWLLAERALYLPEAATLVVADLHVGKSATFRAAALAVPGGITEHDLERLSGALERTRARRLVVLGDLLHARAGRAPRTLAALAVWRQRHGDLELVLVRGNHDRRAGDPPPELGFHCFDGPWIDPLSGWACRHEPERSGAVYTLAGHLHPSVRLLGSGRQAETLPCFHFGPEIGVLPAFGGFTGSRRVRPRRGDRVFVVAGGEVLPVD
jgi:DNA ligase-associated metallophosphoesterase